jgi:hypothetical protein
MEITNRHVEKVLGDYIERYLEGNKAASVVVGKLDELGIGLRPVLDHVSIRTGDIRERALEFEALGYTYDDRLGVIEHDTYWAKVYRKPGFPAIYMDQAFDDHRGDASGIPEWVRKFSDGGLHHIGICVDVLENAMARFSAHGVAFSNDINGESGSEFRQVYSEPELVDGVPHSLLELVERRWGYAGFVPPMPKVS